MVTSPTAVNLPLRASKKNEEEGLEGQALLPSEHLQDRPRPFPGGEEKAFRLLLEVGAEDVGEVFVPNLHPEGRRPLPLHPHLHLEGVFPGGEDPQNLPRNPPPQDHRKVHEERTVQARDEPRFNAFVAPPHSFRPTGRSPRGAGSTSRSPFPAFPPFDLLLARLEAPATGGPLPARGGPSPDGRPHPLPQRYQTLCERAFLVLARKGERPLPEPIEGDRNPHLEGRRKAPAPGEAGERREEAQRPAPAPPGPEGPPKPQKEARPPGERGPRRDPVRVWRAPEEEAPGGLGLPPPLPKGQVMGLVGEGPYYLVLRPEALALWWPKVERLLPEFPRKYEVRWYPDGSRAVVAWDLEALKVWYKRVLRG